MAEERPACAAATALPPAVTAVVPTHHRPARMREAVRSIVDQSYEGHIEIIVVFDACEVDLPDLDLPHHRSLRGLPNDRVRGLAGARNSGIVAAQHDFVAFLDDDDRWLPDKLAAWQQRPFDAIFKGTDWQGTPKGYRLERAMASVGVDVVYFPYTRHTSSSMLRSFLAEDGAGE